MKKSLIFFLFLSILATSCKKDDKNCDLNSSNLVGIHKITSFTYKANATAPPFDVLSTLDACEKDDLITFNANNTITYTDAGMVCTPTGNDVGTWSLSGSTLIIDGETSTVASFDCSTMVLTIAGTSAGEVTTVTLKRQ